ncbi:MAG: EamA family transporter [Polyangia bacterium]
MDPPDRASAPPSPPALRGAFLGLLAAALFGVSAPLAKRLLGELRPQLLAGLLYLGAGLSLSLYRAVRRRTDEAPLRRGDALPLFGVVLLGGVLGPLFMLLGLSRLGALTGSLLLNLEAPFTIFLAVLLFREHLGRYAAVASALILAGAALLRLETGATGADGSGVLLVAGACLCWALDNNLTQRLTLRDPVALVRIKALGAGTVNLLIALALGARLPAVPTLLAALLLGSLSYGVSVVLDAYALRIVGAAREAAFFATAPFLGALGAVVLCGERLRLVDVSAMAGMALGVVLLLRERHAHQHAHEALSHEHVHTHDEHHQHTHAPGDPPGEPHSHAHRHAQLVHDHPHTPDLHHRHEH